MVDTASLASLAPYTLTVGAITLALAAWLIRLPLLAMVALSVSLIIGQSLRWPLPGQGGGVLSSDLVVILVILAALLQSFFQRKEYYPLISNSHFLKKYQLSNYQIPQYHLRALSVSHLFLPFIVWSLFTLVINSDRYELSELVVAAAYWVRLTGYLLLLPSLLVLIGNRRLFHSVSRSLVLAITVIAVLGLGQVLLIPDLSILKGGWDPHNGRIVSTWLDPNFLGAFLGLGLFFFLVRTAPMWLERKKISWFIFNLVVIVLALVGTQSRSTLVALSGTIILISPVIILRLIHRPRGHNLIMILVFSSTFIIISLVSILMLGERAMGLITSDATVQLRAESLKQVWQIAREQPLFGIGYNAYQFAAAQAGLNSDYQIHSRAGADNSLLTLLLTTGLTGVFLFMIPWLSLAIFFVSSWLRRGHILSLAAATSIIFLFLHAQFVNSFLYSHLLIMLALICALAVASSLFSGKIAKL